MSETSVIALREAIATSATRRRCRFPSADCRVFSLPNTLFNPPLKEAPSLPARKLILPALPTRTSTSFVSSCSQGPTWTRAARRAHGGRPTRLAGTAGATLRVLQVWTAFRRRICTTRRVIRAFRGQRGPVGVSIRLDWARQDVHGTEIPRPDSARLSGARLPLVESLRPQSAPSMRSPER